MGAAGGTRVLYVQRGVETFLAQAHGFIQEDAKNAYALIVRAVHVCKRRRLDHLNTEKDLLDFMITLISLNMYFDDILDRRLRVDTTKSAADFLEVIQTGGVFEYAEVHDLIQQSLENERLEKARHHGIPRSARLRGQTPEEEAKQFLITTMFHEKSHQ